MRPLSKYILDHGIPQVADSVEGWHGWMEKHWSDCQIDRTVLEGCYVSTVFTGFDPHRDPLRHQLFETCVIGGPMNGYSRRTSSLEEAMEAHHQCVFELSGQLPQHPEEEVEQAPEGGEDNEPAGDDAEHEQGVDDDTVTLPHDDPSKSS